MTADLDAIAEKADRDFTLRTTCERLAELRIQRDQLIRTHPGSLREIARAAGLSPETVRLIRLKP